MAAKAFPLAALGRAANGIRNHPSLVYHRAGKCQGGFASRVRSESWLAQGEALRISGHQSPLTRIAELRSAPAPRSLASCRLFA
jgi:hypothetical protein